MSTPFEGTLFRFPLRSATTAKASDIKSQFHDVASIIELTEQYRAAVLSSLLFLRSVSTIEVYVLLPAADESGEGVAALSSNDAPRLLFSASAQGRGAGRVAASRKPASATASTAAPASCAAAGTLIGPQYLAELCARDVVGADLTAGVPPAFLALTADGPSRWQSIPRFILEHSSSAPGGGASSSKASFLSSLASTPEPSLPRETHLVRLYRADMEYAAAGSRPSGAVVSASTYIVSARLGGGRARAMACNPDYAADKLLPWAGAAARLAQRVRHVNFSAESDALIERGPRWPFGDGLLSALYALVGDLPRTCAIADEGAVEQLEPTHVPEPGRVYTFL